MPAFARFVAARFSAAMATMILVSLIVFTLMELVPGNCAERYIAYKASQGFTITDADIRAEEVRMGLDRPFVVRWIDWVTGVFFRFDLGESCLWRVSVNQLIGDKLLLSFGLAGGALVLTYALAVPIGMASASMRGGWLDGTIRILSYLGLALPNFLLALIIMLFSTIWFGDTMTGLFSDEFREAPWTWARFADLMSNAWMPIFILAWSAMAIQIQTVRAMMSDEQDKLYVTAARARGLSGGTLLLRYPARHALGPVVNSVGFDLNRIFNDLPIVAAVLILTEAGALLLEALALSNDQQLAGAIILSMTALIVLLNFLTDILLAVLDPRIRKGFF